MVSLVGKGADLYLLSISVSDSLIYYAIIRYLYRWRERCDHYSFLIVQGRCGGLKERKAGSNLKKCPGARYE